MSIGYYSSFSDDGGVLVRDDMTEKSGIELVRKFLSVLEGIRIKHYHSLSVEMKERLRFITNISIFLIKFKEQQVNE